MVHQKAWKAAKVEKFQSSVDGKIQTTRAGAISQSDYRTTEMLAKKSEIFITSLPNFMAFHWRNCEESHCQIFCFLCSYWCQKMSKMKPRVRWAFLSIKRLLNKLASSAHMQLLNFREPPWTILTNERIKVVLTMERCRLWSTDQCFNEEGHFKKPTCTCTLFATLPIASKYSALPLTEVSASKVSAIKKKIL